MSSVGGFFVLLVAAFVTDGRCDDASAEANVLALEASGELLAPDTLTQKLAEELKAIRTAYPAVNDVVYHPPWVPGELLAEVSDEQIEQIRIQYGEVKSDTLFDTYKTLTFTTKYNPVVLASELKTKNLVTSAEPNNVIGADGGVRYNAQSGVYTFNKGWGDCLSGCINNHYWEFSVSKSKKVELLKEYSSPLEEGTTSYLY